MSSSPHVGEDKIVQDPTNNIKVLKENSWPANDGKRLQTYQVLPTVLQVNLQKKRNPITVQWRIQLWAVRSGRLPSDQNLGLVMAARLRHGDKFSLKSLTFGHFLYKNVQNAFSFRG